MKVRKVGATVLSSVHDSIDARQCLLLIVLCMTHELAQPAILLIQLRACMLFQSRMHQQPHASAITYTCAYVRKPCIYAG